MAFAIPRCAPNDPLVLDIAVTQAAFGMVQKIQAAGGKIPEGWMHDEEGNWLMDPIAANMRVGHLLISIDPGSLINCEVFLERVEQICERIANALALPGRAIRLPGQPEQEALRRWKTEGIPLTPRILNQLSKLAFEMPASISARKSA